MKFSILFWPSLNKRKNINKQLNDEKGLSIVNNSLYILDLPKYRQQEGNYSHYPFRFWAGNRLLGGYSDHLAIKIKIKKNWITMLYNIGDNVQIS